MHIDVNHVAARILTVFGGVGQFEGRGKVERILILTQHSIIDADESVGTEKIQGRHQVINLAAIRQGIKVVDQSVDLIDVE
ncbi:MAG: hypothetical protein BWY72_02320 [Bacteroidetes bacterium ADurb.Bin416]|nr:MAG: hypothetical protein BWY72_02320 [Bacteroidetes bacterium ADurb.Bin416]